MTEEAILRFVSRSFRSVWPLEVLLLLSQEPRKDWRIDELAHELRANLTVVTQALDALAAVQFVAADQDRGYRFQPASAELNEMASALVDLYLRKPRAVMRVIFSAPVNRIQSFADAFRLRKDQS